MPGADTAGAGETTGGTDTGGGDAVRWGGRGGVIGGRCGAGAGVGGGGAVTGGAEGFGREETRSADSISDGDLSTAVASCARRTSWTTRVTSVVLLRASGRSRSTPAAAVWLGALSPGPTTRTKRTSFVDGSLRTIVHSSCPSMPPSRAPRPMTSV